MSKNAIGNPALDKEVKEYENKIAFLKAEIRSRQKLLDQMQSIDKPSSENMVHMLQRQEDEILVRDKQIIALNQRLEKLDKGGLQKELQQKDKQLQQYEKAIRSLESDKIDLVEQQQELKVEIERKEKVYKDQLKEKDVEIENLNKKIEEWSDIIKKLEQNIQDYQEEINERQQEINNLKEELNKEVDAKSNVQDKLDDEFKLKEELWKRCSSLEEDIEELKKTNNELWSDKKTLGEAKTTVENAYEQSKKELVKLREEMTSIQNHQSELDTIRSKAQDQENGLRTKIDSLEKEIMNYKLKEAEKDREIDKLAIQIKELQNKAKENQRYSAEDYEEIEENKTRVFKLSKENEEQKEKIEYLNEQIKEYQDRIASLEDKVNIFKTQIDQTENTMNTKNSIESENIINELKEEVGRKLKVIDELNTIIIKNKEEIAKLKTQMISAQTEVESVRASLNVQEQLGNSKEIENLKQKLSEQQERYDAKVESLLNYEKKFREMEEQNKQFEELTKNLKAIIREVQDKMDMALVRTDRLEKEIETKDQELEEEVKKNVYSDKKITDLSKKIKEYHDLLHQRDKELMKKDQTAIKMMDEINLLRKRVKDGSYKLNKMIQEQAAEYESKIKEKDTEVHVLKEMLKSSKTMLRMRESEIERMRKGKENPNQSNTVSQQLPSISKRDSLRKSNLRHQSTYPIQDTSQERISKVASSQNTTPQATTTHQKAAKKNKRSLILDAEDAFEGIGGNDAEQGLSNNNNHPNHYSDPEPQQPVVEKKKPTSDYRDLSFLSQQHDSSSVSAPKQQFRSIQDDVLDSQRVIPKKSSRRNSPQNKGSNIFDPSIDPAEQSERMYISPVKVTKKNRKKKNTIEVDKLDNGKQKPEKSTLDNSMEESAKPQSTATFKGKETL